MQGTRQTPFGDVPKDWPFHGLIPYDQQSPFDGRDIEIEDLLDLIRMTRTCVAFGPSGVGKTSLLKAGLVKRLHDEAEERRQEKLPLGLFPVYFDQWHEPDLFKALKRCLLQQVDQGIASQLRPDSIVDNIDSLLKEWPQDRHGRLLLIFDQFEQFFLYRDTKDRVGVLKSLLKALRSEDQSVRLLIAMREDSVARLDLLTRYHPGVLSVRRRIPPLRLSQAVSVFRKLLGGRRKDVEDGLLKSICRQARGNAEIDLNAADSDPTVELGWVQMALEAIGGLEDRGTQLTLPELMKRFKFDGKPANFVSIVKHHYVERASSTQSDPQLQAALAP